MAGTITERVSVYGVLGCNETLPPAGFAEAVRQPAVPETNPRIACLLLAVRDLRRPAENRAQVSETGNDETQETH